MALSEGEPSTDEINDNKVFNRVFDIRPLTSVFWPHAREVYEQAGREVLGWPQ